ncbi:MAG: hypothetical protein ACREA2_00100 [Blastocatellia bacterium]
MPGVKLGCLPPEESANLTRAVLDLYKLGYTRGFKAGADLDDVTPPRRDALEEQWLKRGLLARMREYWQGFKKSLRSIRATIIRKARRKPHRRFPTETLSSNWVIRR